MIRFVLIGHGAFPNSRCARKIVVVGPFSVVSNTEKD